MKKSASVYLRKADGVYVIPQGVTTQGFSYETEPFEYLPGDPTAENVWAAIKKALSNANRVVPHPSSWEQETAWYRRAGVKTWRQFASKAKSLQINEAGIEFEFKVLHWEEGSFVGRREDVFRIQKDASMMEIEALLKQCFSRA